MTHPFGTLGFSHLFNAALVEFALHLALSQYLGKAKVGPGSKILFAAHSEILTNSTCLLLHTVFSLHHGCSTRLM